jgi:inorganic triphosphatase YgiF
MTVTVKAFRDSTTAGREVELKLHVAPADLPRVAALPVLLAHADGDGPAVRHLRTVYFDTPDVRLFTLGVALRVRHCDGRFRQTLKTVNSAAPGDSPVVTVRRVWEWPVDSETPDFALVDAEGLTGLVPVELRDALAPVFVTDFTRTALFVHPDPMTTIEVAIDEGEVVAGDRHRRISEVELELKAGSVGRLFDFARDIHHHVPTRIGSESKAGLGYRLLTGQPPAAVPPGPLGLLPATTAAEAFRHIIRHSLGLVHVNEPCTASDGDPAGVLGMTIGLRRLRAAFKLFEPVIGWPEDPPLRPNIAWFADSLRPLRQWDVLLAAIGQCRNGHCGGGHCGGGAGGSEMAAELDALANAARRARRLPLATALRALRAPRRTSLMLALPAWLEEGRWLADAEATGRAGLDRPVKELASVWLSDRLAKIRKPGKPAELPEPERHDRLRRRLRTLRQAVEFFGDIDPVAARGFAATIDPLQAALDADRDAAVIRHLLMDVAAAAPRAAADVERWLDAQAQERAAALPELWRVFKAAPAFWT